MVKRYIKKTPILIPILITAMLFVGCGNAENLSENIVSNTNVSNVSKDTTDGNKLIDNLPDIDLEGKTFNILIREEVGYEFDAEQTGEIVNDVVYIRNIAVSERFNLNINYKSSPGLWSSRNEYQNLITSVVLANDPDYDIVTGQSNIIIPMAAQGYYNELSDSQYIDFSMPYWKSGYHDNIKIYNRLYTLCGDYALTALTRSNVIFFNKSLMDEYGIVYPYDLVKEGNWTLDKFLEIVYNIAVDINGDGVMDKEDLYGFCAYNNSIDPFFASNGLGFTSLDSDGKREIDFPNDKAVDVFEKIFKLVHSDSFINASTNYVTEGMASTEDGMAIEFKNGKMVMMGMVLDGVEKLRDMDIDFGLIPYPKYDENQDRYYTSVTRTYTIAAIPISAPEYEMPELLLEALAYEGYNNIVPTYYEIALKDKYTRDEASAEMLDIVSATSWFDFTDAYYTDLGGISSFISTYALGETEGMVSRFEANRNAFQANLEKLFKAYEK